MQEYGIYEKLMKYCLAIVAPYSKPELLIHADVMGRTPSTHVKAVIKTERKRSRAAFKAESRSKCLWDIQS